MSDGREHGQRTNVRVCTWLGIVAQAPRAAGLRLPPDLSIGVCIHFWLIGSLDIMSAQHIGSDTSGSPARNATLQCQHTHLGFNLSNGVRLWELMVYRAIKLPVTGSVYTVRLGVVSPPVSRPSRVQEHGPTMFDPSQPPVRQQLLVFCPESS